MLVQTSMHERLVIIEFREIFETFRLYVSLYSLLRSAKLYGRLFHREKKVYQKFQRTSLNISWPKLSNSSSKETFLCLIYDLASGQHWRRRYSGGGTTTTENGSSISSPPATWMLFIVAHIRRRLVRTKCWRARKRLRLRRSTTRYLQASGMSFWIDFSAQGEWRIFEVLIGLAEESRF